MKILRVLIALLFVAVLGAQAAQAQTQTAPCQNETDEIMPQGVSCAMNVNNLSPGQFQATPFVDAVQVNGQWPDYTDPGHNVVSLYNTYGNTENNPTYPAAQAHYQQGITLASNIKPRCQDGSIPSGNCPNGQPPPAIVFLFIGFSNFDIEMGGGSTDAWTSDPNGMLDGQPCSSICPNLNSGNPLTPFAWNQVPNDTTIQKSVLYQVYNPNPWLVGTHVVIWNGALEGQTLPQWDPTSYGYYASNTCTYNPYMSDDPECNYDRVGNNLMRATANGNNGGYSEAQVQAVFIKAADAYPQCDLKGSYCNAGSIPDAYLMEKHLGNIVRYLKCCKLDAQHHSTGLPRYPNLQQVFITSRIYGGYANGQPVVVCENPEPFAYEGGFAVQRLIVDQINQVATYPGPVTYDYAGEVDYSTAPWIDWGPYLWASGGNPRNFDHLFWCGGVAQGLCSNTNYDVRQGDVNYPTTYWGDFTHPNANGQQKVANLLVNFMNRTTGSPWITPWIGQ